MKKKALRSLQPGESSRTPVEAFKINYLLTTKPANYIGPMVRIFSCLQLGGKK
jgi:hypothetical protein